VVLAAALQTNLLDEALVAVFCAEYTRHPNVSRREVNAAREAQKSELAKLGKERANIIRAIKDGVSADLVRADLEAVAARQEELEELLAARPMEPRPLVHPALAGRYRAEVKSLREGLKDEARRGEAAELLRGLVGKVVFTPKDEANASSINLYGDPAGIWRSPPMA
jgi:hypothetical protein